MTQRKWGSRAYQTQSRQWSLDILHAHWEKPRDGTLLGYVLPPFQRPAVWSQAQQTRFIESFVLGLPVGTWMYNVAPEGSDDRTDRWLLDGQQRLTAIRGFFDDGLEVFGRYFSDLSTVERRRFLHVGFPALETSESDEMTLREIYNRMNFGGTPHTPDQKAEVDSDYDINDVSVFRR